MHPFDYYVFQYDNEITIPEKFQYKDAVKILQLNEVQMPDAPFENYGALAGLYYIWKKETSPYIAFNISMRMINPCKQELEELMAGKIDVLLLEPANLKHTLQENYRREHYGYDYEIMLEVLGKYEPLYYKFAKEQILNQHKFLPFAGIMKKEIFRKFCSWLFRLLKNSSNYISVKTSKYQNQYLEHLSAALFLIYFKYNEQKLKLKCISSGISVSPRLLYDKKAVIEEGELFERVQEMVARGALEEAEYYVTQSKEPCAGELKELFKKYHAQRHYYKQTLFEKSTDLNKLLEDEKSLIIKAPLHKKKRALIFRWSSITHFEAVMAFENLGFECHSVAIKYTDRVYDEKFLKDMNKHLDENTYDVVYSINYFAMISEACYVHGIPYVAWCYDSPTFVGDIHYLRYPTTHVFFFDSLEAERYQGMGVQNAHYMPLAVNVERFDKIVCTPEEVQKYQAEISFVGSLYDSNLAEAFQYLDDYKKAYLNALVENQSGQYSYELFSSVITSDFIKWFSQKEFEKVLNAIWDKMDSTSVKQKSAGMTAGRLKSSLSRFVTNRERLLLISMLANHWHFKLYSTSGHEVLKNVIECGTVEYYQEMPKVFKNSRINLNVTLHTILSGIPLRCLDIMGCHGLLLTNYQRDFEEHFKDHENLLFYHCMEEAYDKAKYYLEHETERQRIEDNGYETVKKYYNYPVLLRKVLSLADLEYLFD